VGESREIHSGRSQDCTFVRETDTHTMVSGPGVRRLLGR
jgi:hypothetical protein